MKESTQEYGQRPREITCMLDCHCYWLLKTTTCGSKKDDMDKEKGTWHQIHQQLCLHHSMVSPKSSSAAPSSSPVICKTKNTKLPYPLIYIDQDFKVCTVGCSRPAIFKWFRAYIVLSCENQSSVIFTWDLGRSYNRIIIAYQSKAPNNIKHQYCIS
jgi:hypothetical protein